MPALTLAATRIGTFAADIVAGGGSADVIAVFDRSFYLLCGKGIVAVCVDDLGAGPLNCLVPASNGAAPWHGLRLQTGMKATISRARLSIDGRLTILLDQATEWSPPPWPAWSAGNAAASLAALARLWPADQPGIRSGTAPDRGLAPLIFAPASAAAGSATALAARDQIAALGRSLPTALATGRLPAEAIMPATLLVGLGPGLTPSGDDVLGGLCLALHARGKPDLAAALFEVIVDDLDGLTVPVSAMHLTAAAHGMGHEAMHALLACLVTNDEPNLAACLDAVTGIGATSGWDAVAGIAMGLTA